MCLTVYIHHIMHWNSRLLTYFSLNFLRRLQAEQNWSQSQSLFCLLWCRWLRLQWFGSRSRRSSHTPNSISRTPSTITKRRFSVLPSSRCTTMSTLMAGPALSLVSRALSSAQEQSVNKIQSSWYSDLDFSLWLSLVINIISSWSIM